MEDTILNYSEEWITPEIAKEYLKKNSVNRTLNPKRAAQYAEDMKSNNWQLNGEAIGFYDDGSLSNGQHRLTAIIIANRPVLCTVIRNIPRSSSVQDRGRARDVVDAFLLEGMDSSIANTGIVAIAKLHVTMQQLGNSNVPDGKIREFLKRNEELLRFVGRVTSKSKKNGTVNTKVAPLALACFYALNSHIASKEQIASFLRVVKTGIPTDMNQQSALVLRNDIISQTLPTAGYNRKLFLYATEKAIVDFCTGTNRKISYSRVTGPVFSDRPENKNA